ncbi:MAG: SulP family inorganic anion transporter [Chloroflexota bacterium]
MLNKLAIFRLWQIEFKNYSVAHLKNDAMAGLTVAAVALPLALAFGVASGATPGAGMVTAIISGFIIGALSGAPYQISGPTGALSAVLILIVQKYGLPGLWLAGIMSGVMILVLGILKLGRIVNFIPAPVITGFTSGIAVIIFVGQIDNFLGITTKSADSTTLKLVGYFTEPWQQKPNVDGLAVVACALIVMAVMLILPRFNFTKRFPAALVGIILASLAAYLLSWKVPIIGKIPSTIILDDRYFFRPEDFSRLGDLIAPASAIAMLGAIESLLAGVVAGRMTGKKLDANQELVAQGIGNIILPFAGGVPATAAIARISVGVKAGGQTRLVSFIHSAALLLSALLLSEMIGRIPVSALSGVLMVTAFRMNEWHLIKFYFKRRLKSPSMVLVVTTLATVTFDLTQAIIIGIIFSLVLFLSKVSNLEIKPTDVDWKRMREAGFEVSNEKEGIKVIYISGSLFFGAVGQFIDTLESLPPSNAMILSMRGVPMLDASGLHAVEHIWQHQLKHSGLLLITGLQEPVTKMFERSGLIEQMGEDKFFWSADQAIRHACELLTESPVSTRQVNAASRTASLGATDLTDEEELEDEMPFGVVKVE